MAFPRIPFSFPLAPSGIWALVQYNSLHVLFPKKTYALACGVGAVITLLSVFGYCSAKKHNKGMLTVYALVMLALVAAEVGAGAYAVKYAHSVEHDDDPKDAVNQLLHCSFDFCCDHERPPEEACTNIDHWINTGDNRNVCSIFPAAYQKGQPACNDFAVFRAGIIKWFKENDLPIGIALISVGAAQFLAVCAAIGMLCMQKEPKALTEEERQALYYDQQDTEAGGALAYGTGGPIATADVIVTTEATATYPPPSTALTYA